MSDDMGMQWRRPPGPLKVWKVIDGVRKNGNEEPVKLIIQEIPEDRYDDAIDHMLTYFIVNEVISSSLNIKDDELAKADLRSLWKGVLKQGVSIAAFVQNSENEKPEIAGMNVLLISTKQDKKKADVIQTDSIRKIVTLMGSLTAECNVWDRYNVDTYMDAYGLSVKPCFQGQGLAQKLLETRIDVGREYNILATATTFTSPTSQKLATRAGFDVLMERDYNTVVDEKGNLYFPKVKVKSVKIMARRLN